ncbi:MAG: GNAT family N-acetyltransferase [Proteobacteria bacterium]|nr:GNAT family N-acetyltransferase [Pseudomonadota bacterium]
MATGNDSLILIRDAVPDDINGLASLLKDLFAIERDFDFDLERHKKGLAMLLDRSQEACAIVAEDIHTQKIVGMCTAQRLVSTAEGGFAAMVEDVVVRKFFRRQGVGRRLLDELLKWAETNRVVRLQLLYDISNTPALSFYQSLGWRFTSLSCLRRN